MAKRNQSGLGCLLVMVLIIGASAVLVWKRKADKRAEQDAARAQMHEELVVKNGTVGVDPFGWHDASDMKPPYKMVPLSARGRVRVNTIERRLSAGALPEQADVWQALTELTPEGWAPEVQAAVPRWAQLAARSAGRQLPVSEYACSVTYNSQYRSGNFSDASQGYRGQLQGCAKSLDARNNLGLAQLHLGNDMTAQMELETALALAPDYVPAMVNLTVVLERGGQFGRARELAMRAASGGEMVPAAVFNAAWYENIDGKYEDSERRLAPLVDLNLGRGHSKLLDLDKRRVGAVPAGR